MTKGLGSQKAGFKEIETGWNLLSKTEVFCLMWENEKDNEMTDWWLELRLNLSQRPLGGTHTITNILRRGDLICKLSFKGAFTS